MYYDYDRMVATDGNGNVRIISVRRADEDETYEHYQDLDAR